MLHVLVYLEKSVFSAALNTQTAFWSAIWIVQPPELRKHQMQPTLCLVATADIGESPVLFISR